MSTAVEVRLAGPEDADAWFDLGAATHRENGSDGYLTAPYSPSAPPRTDEPDRRARLLEEIARPLDVPHWRRLWLAIERGIAIGSVTLYGLKLPSEMHRCVLGIAVRRAAQRRGIGTSLMRTAIEWARAEPTLSWIDLGVFSRNRPARALYQRLGFVERGTTRDRFRVDGESIDDVEMSLAV